MKLERLEDTLDLELAALGRGERLGLEPHTEALFLVCTHGRHDMCCAERGRPLAQALAGAFPEQTWECSHIGGDRFAGNVVAFPHGLYFGRVAPAEAEAIARAYLEGRINLAHFRGRSCRSMPVQAGEHALRSALRVEELNDVELVAAHRAGEDVVATFRTAAGRFQVRVRVEEGPRYTLTCRSTGEATVLTYRAVVEAG